MVSSAHVVPCLGFHWIFDKTAGHVMADSIADYAMQHALLPMGHQ